MFRRSLPEFGCLSQGSPNGVGCLSAVAVEIERYRATPLGSDRHPLRIPMPWAMVPRVGTQAL
jgi:hypothetical protein